MRPVPRPPTQPPVATSPVVVPTAPGYRRAVLASVSTRHQVGYVAWSAMTADGYRASGILTRRDTGPDAIHDAQFRALEALAIAPELDGVQLHLLRPGSESLNAALSCTLARTDRFVIAEPTGQTFLLAMACSDNARDTLDAQLARDRADQLRPERHLDILYAATDGGVPNNSLSPATYAAITAEGSYWSGTVHTRSPRIAELRAVHELLVNTSRYRRTVVLLDSRDAIRNLVAARDEGLVPPGSRAWLNTMPRLLDDRPVSFRWVRGHCGHPLNEGADDLARQARRFAETEATGQVRQAISERIVDEATSGFAAWMDAGNDPVSVTAKNPTLSAHAVA